MTDTDHDQSVAAQLEPDEMEWIVNQIAHAMRNPVFAALVQTEALAMQAKDEATTRRAAEMLNRQLRRLERSLNEMLLYGRPARIEPTEVHVADLLRSVADSYTSGQRGTTAEVEVAVDDPDLRARWDGKAVRIILERVLDNAVQHSQPPHHVVLTASADGHQQVALTVRDQGEGMDPEILEQAFLPFFPQHRGRPGLGLAVAAKFVRLLGGSITITSQLGFGTEVRCTLPRESRGLDP